MVSAQREHGLVFGEQKDILTAATRAFPLQPLLQSMHGPVLGPPEVINPDPPSAAAHASTVRRRQARRHPLFVTFIPLAGYESSP